MKEIFDNYVKNSFGEEKQAIFKFKQFEMNYRNYFPANKDDAVLDIGVGRGEMLSCYAEWGYKNYLGIDISPSTIKFCKSLGLNCELVEDSGLYLKKHQDKYKLITLIDVLEHIPREFVVEFLKCVRNALADDGVFIIQVPNLQAPDGQLHMYNDITHVAGYIEHSLAQVLITAGFEKFYFQGFEEFVNNNWKTKILKMLRNIYWKKVQLSRKINGNLNPEILNPVFSVIVKK
ncbi:class I SAM-dependent methyltransferase [Psychromonas sp. PT13]|uniref:class I SAM-dependent methyltransferase n=1 Tax=Psychromonas sp. PT13 TaxID=3439547 RepID=UPI003EBD6C46